MSSTDAYLTSRCRLYVGDTDWLAEPDIGGFAWPAAGQIDTRFAVGGGDWQFAYPVQAQDRIDLAGLYYGTSAELLASKTEGICCVVLDPGDAHISLPVAIPSDQIAHTPLLTATVPLAHGVGFATVAAPADAAKDRVKALDLTAAASSANNLRFDHDDILLLVVTDASVSAARAVTLTSTASTPAVNVSAPGIWRLANPSSWAGAITDAVLAAGGMAGNDSITGYLLTGPQSQVQG